MCAAPGSKTSQLVEMLHCDEGKAPGIIFFYYLCSFMTICKLLIFCRRFSYCKRFEQQKMLSVDSSVEETAITKSDNYKP